MERPLFTGEGSMKVLVVLVELNVEETTSVEESADVDIEFGAFTAEVSTSVEVVTKLAEDLTSVKVVKKLAGGLTSLEVVGAVDKGRVMSATGLDSIWDDE